MKRRVVTAKFKDITGMNFHRLRVLNPIMKSDKHRNRLFLCKCDCGILKTVSGYNLRRGHVKSCGCLDHSDLTGRKFNYWTVIELATSNTKSRKWLCRCLCGEERIVHGCSLVAGSSKSCGCFIRRPIRKWVHSEIEMVRRFYPSSGRSLYLSELLGRTPDSIRGMAERLGISVNRSDRGGRSGGSRRSYRRNIGHMRQRSLMKAFFGVSPVDALPNSVRAYALRRIFRLLERALITSIQAKTFFPLAMTGDPKKCAPIYKITLQKQITSGGTNVYRTKQRSIGEVGTC